jgi:hypothetical protein
MSDSGNFAAYLLHLLVSIYSLSLSQSDSSNFAAFSLACVCCWCQAGASADEWQAAVSAGLPLGDAGEELVAELNRLPCFLVMEYVHGQPLYKSTDAFKVGSTCTAIVQEHDAFQVGS